MATVHFAPEKIIGEKLTGLSRQSLCEFASGLCAAVKADAGVGGYRGGIFPSNISTDENGGIAVGAASPGAWEGEELQFIAPELYWNGRRTPASDVYSVGMVMYYAANGGKLPFEGECADPQLRRMSGSEFPMPRSAGRRLCEIIAKATSFKAEDRYQSMDEMKTVLDACIRNVFTAGTTVSESVFGKNDDALSDIERMMVSIMEQGEISQEAPELPPVESLSEEELLKPKSAPVQPEEPETEDVKVYTVPEEQTEEEELPVVELHEEKNPLIAPIVFSDSKTPAVQYTRSLERERKIAEQVKRRRMRPVAVVLILCALLLIAALVLKTMSGDLRSADIVFGTPDPDPAPAMVTPIVVPTPNPAVVHTPEPVVDTPAPVVEHTYKLYVEDISWEVAERRCEELGGHLVTIADVDELQIVTDLAEEQGVSRVWVGCRRMDNEMIWVTGEQISFYPWAKGEPSFVDSGDDVDEDYVLLWDHNGWSYNDSRNDPVRDYPEMYSGNLAYVCEIDG